MASISRYAKTTILGGENVQYGTGNAHTQIRSAIKNGSMPFDRVYLTERQRLDHLSALYYGDSQYWWVIAAASNIGWGLQVPPNTEINVPDFQYIIRLLG